MEDAWTDARVPVSATHVIQSKPAMSDLSVPDDTKGALLNVADGAQNGKAHDVASQTALAIINLSRAKKQRARMLKMLGTVTGSDGQPKCIRITAQPKLLVGGTLQAHQMQGLQWLIDGRMTGTGQILADGKSIVTVFALVATTPDQTACCRHGAGENHSSHSILRSASGVVRSRS